MQVAPLRLLESPLETQTLPAVDPEVNPQNTVSMVFAAASAMVAFSASSSAATSKASASAISSSSASVFKIL